MAEVVSELDKLREAAKLIEEMSQGRLQVCPSVVGQVYIRPENEAYLGLDMRINSIPGQLRYRVTFSSQMRRMGADMTSEGLRTLLSEVGQTYALLTALESRSYTPTTEDLTERNIIENRLIYHRRKTGKLINLPIQQRAYMVLKEYKKSNEPYLFPILSSEHKTEQQRLNRLHKVITKVNKELKAIGEELHIPIKLTTYFVRHSYATVLKRAGVSTSIISESLGHS